MIFSTRVPTSLTAHQAVQIQTEQFTSRRRLVSDAVSISPKKFYLACADWQSSAHVSGERLPSMDRPHHTELDDGVCDVPGVQGDMNQRHLMHQNSIVRTAINSLMTRPYGLAGVA